MLHSLEKMLLDMERITRSVEATCKLMEAEIQATVIVLATAKRSVRVSQDTADTCGILTE